MSWVVGRHYNARELCTAFRMGGRVRGIGRSPSGEVCIVVGSRREGSVYKDQLLSNEIWYRGEGLRGHQELRRGNRYLADALAEGRPVAVFRFERKNAYRYLGQAMPTGMTWAIEPDVDGSDRTVVLFTFRLVP